MHVLTIPFSQFQAAVVIAASLQDWIDFAIMIALLIVNAVVAFAQEYQADNIVDSLKKTLAMRARVVRNGCIVDIGTEEVVLGDIVHVKDVSSRRLEKKKGTEDFDANIPFRAQSLRQMAK